MYMDKKNKKLNILMIIILLYLLFLFIEYFRFSYFIYSKPAIYFYTKDTGEEIIYYGLGYSIEYSYYETEYSTDSGYKRFYDRNFYLLYFIPCAFK